MINKPAAGSAGGAPLHVKMLEMGMAHMRAQALCVAARLGITDLPSDGPKAVEEIARAPQAHPRSLYRLLRALASIGVFVELEDGHFDLTRLAETLRSGMPNSVRSALLLAGTDYHWNSWSHLSHSIMTGECAFEHVHGRRFFDYLSRNPEAGAIFDAWMTRASQLQAAGFKLARVIATPSPLSLVEALPK